MTAPPVVGVAEHYSQFVKLARLRIEQLGVTMDTVDAICGFPSRYTATLLCGKKSMSIYSFFTLARALALLPSFQHDEMQFAQLRTRADWIKVRRRGPHYRGRHDAAVKFQLPVHFYRQIGRKGALARSLLLKKRRAQTEKARAARWGRQ